MTPHILVPFDFSDAAERALRWAVELQQSIGAGTVHAVHATNPVPLMSVAAAPVVVPFYTDEQLASAERALKDALATYDTAVTGEVIVTPAVGDAILTVAQQRAANLIVMGTHGRGGIKRAFLGSVADYVVRNAACPVVTMRAKGAE